MGDCVSPNRKQEVVDRLRERLERYRQQQSISYQKYAATLPGRWQSDKQDTRTLCQRVQDSKNKRPAKNVKQEDKQTKVWFKFFEKFNFNRINPKGKSNVQLFVYGLQKSRRTSALYT